MENFPKDQFETVKARICLQNEAIGQVYQSCKQNKITFNTRGIH